MAKIEVRCPNCHREYTVDSSHLGRRARCKGCESGFVLTGSNEASRPAAPAGADTAGRQPSPTAAAEDGVPETWEPGDVILDLYEVKKLLGRGGMGEVWLAHHRHWDTDLAVKCPRADFLEEAGGADEFVREAETWVNLPLHPHLVQAHYVRNLGGIPRIFMEFADGGSLQDWLREGRIDTLERGLDVAVQVAWGIQQAHELGLVHRDLKPLNVMMLADGTPKVTDFGLAKLVQRAAERGAAAGGEQTVAREGGQAGITMGGVIAGTPAYMPPEQWDPHGRISKAADIYAFGVLLYQLLCGRLPFELPGEYAHAAPGFQAALLRKMHEEQPAPDPREFRAELPECLAGLLPSCLAKAPQSRPESLATVCEQLARAYEDFVGEPYPRPEPGAPQLLARSLNNRALSMLDLGNPEEAKGLLDKALDLDPQHPEATYNRCLLLWRTGEMTDEGCTAALEAVREGRGKDWLPWYLLGELHLERRDQKAAAANLQRAEELGDDNPSVQRALAAARDEDGSWRCCLRVLEQDSEPSFVDSVSVTGDGRWALSAHTDGNLKLWDAHTGHCTRTLEGQPGRASAAAISPDGRWAYSGGEDNWGNGRSYMHCWEAQTGR